MMMTHLHRILLMAVVLACATLAVGVPSTNAQSPNPTRRINVPYFGTDMRLGEGAVFWFGQVNNTSNYADVRIGYTNTELAVQLHIFDRRLWYDTSPQAADLENWDAATLYLKLDGNTGSAPTTNAYRFLSQLSWWESRTNYQAAYRGNGTGWSPAATAFSTDAGFRGSFNDTANDRGWTTQFRIPFASLGLSGPPADGTLWGLALVLHDRDDAAGTPIAKQSWPEAVNPQQPASWGQLRFGLPVYNPPAAAPGQTITIRHGLNGVTVTDAEVGGHTICGDPYAPDYFPGWGSANYAGYDQINIQNQWDVADWPCFSRFYIDFPLGSVPAGKSILSATLSMYQFGNAWGPPPTSFIQVHQVNGSWTESTITWNNAPLAKENNVARSWVAPIDGPLVWPGWKRQWDVSQAVATAYAAGQPLQLALYSSDGDYHSGKYFTSSDTADWNAVGRPTLEITVGELYLSAAPSLQTIDFGGTASFAFNLQPIGGSAAPVTLTAGTPPANVSYQFVPAVVTPPGQSTLIVTDSHPPSSKSMLLSIPVSASSSGGTQNTSVQLLIGGQKVYVPLVIRGSP